MFKQNQISKITLGTAQLGSDYGISNKTGKLNNKLALEILNYAIKNGINSFDTAPSYGNSEEILGSCFHGTKNNFQPIIITKIPKIQFSKKSFSEIYGKMKNSIINSMQKLGCSKIPICLLHDPQDSFNDLVISSLNKLKEEKLVESIGVSIYTLDDVRKFLKIKEFDAIQIPFNLFDLRLLNNGLIQKLAKAKKIVFARSIVRQGLFCLNHKKLPAHVSSSRKYLEELHNISNEYEISIPRLALTFARDIQGIDSLVIGVDDVNQLEKNMNILDSPTLSNKIIQRIYKTFNDVPEEIINPNTWLISKM